MAKIYYRRIVAGEMTINDVPNRGGSDGEALLDGQKEGQEELTFENVKGSDQKWKMTDCAPEFVGSCWS